MARATKTRDLVAGADAEAYLETVGEAVGISVAEADAERRRSMDDLFDPVREHPVPSTGGPCLTRTAHRRLLDAIPGAAPLFANT